MGGQAMAGVVADPDPSVPGLRVEPEWVLRIRTAHKPPDLPGQEVAVRPASTSRIVLQLWASSCAMVSLATPRSPGR